MALPGMGAIGLGVTWAIVGFVTERQLRTPGALQGRVQAATNMVLTVPQLLTTVAAAAVVGVMDYRVLVAVTTVGLLLAAVVSSGGARARMSLPA